MSTPFQDPRASDLLSRVSNDVSLLRQDIANLVSHTTRHTLPEGARGLVDTARNRLSDGRLYSAAQLRALRGQIHNQPATAWVGGAVVVGLIAAGVYWFLKEDCCASDEESEEED